MGGLWTLILNGPIGLGAYWAARHGLRQPPGLVRALAAAVLAWAWIVLGLEILGPVGLLDRPPLLAWSAAGLAIGLALRLRDRPKGGPPPESRRRADDGWEPSATAALALTLWPSGVLLARSLVGPVKVVSDGPIYHLYFAARWWKAGRLFLVATPFGESAAPYFPAVGDLGFCWLMVGWGGDRLAKIGQVPFLLLAALAAFAMARRLGAGTSASAIAACWFSASSYWLTFGFETNVDAIFVAGYLLASYFFLRYALGDGGAEALMLGGLAAGGAWGTKATATVFVPPLLLLAALAVLRRGPSAARRLADLAVLLASAMVPAGFWFVRNACLTGNPLYPLQLDALGRTWLPGWYARDAMRQSRFFIDPSHWWAFVDILMSVLDPRLAPVWLAAVGGAWAVGRPRGPLDRWVLLVSAWSALNVALYWLAIPYRTQQRFMYHALGLASVPLAMALDRWRWARWAAVAMLAIHLLTPQSWPFVGPAWDLSSRNPPWDLDPRIPNAIGPLIEWLPGAQGRTKVGIGLAALTVAWAWGRAIGRPGWSRGLAATAASAAMAAASCLSVYPREVPKRLLFYPYFADYFGAWMEFDRLCGPNGSRVAYAGTNLPYYLLGDGLRNEVRYVNVDRHSDWLMHDYHREARARGLPSWPHPRPGWDRSHPDYGDWLANLEAEDIRLLFLARVDPREGPENVDREGFPIEARWADAHPEAFALLRSDPLVRIYLVRNPGPTATDSRSGRHY